MLKKVLVTGGAGFIGSNLVNELIKQGVKVIVVDNLSTGNIDNINPKAKFYKINISEKFAVDYLTELMKDVDAVFHLAAKARVQPSIKDPIGFHETNVNGTLNVLVAAERNKVRRVVYSASSSAYGNGNLLPLKENMVGTTISPYAAQKLIGEIYCKLFYDVYGLQTVSLRYFNIYGENQPTKGAYCTILGIFTRQKNEGKPLTITNDGEQRRDMTYVQDVVRANISAATSDKVGKGDIINIGSGTNYSVNEIAALFGGPTEFIGDVLEPRETLADNSKAKELLNWEPTMDVVTWIKNNIK